MPDFPRQRWMVVGLMIAGCAPAAAVRVEDPSPVEVSVNFAGLPALLPAIGAGELRLYEGLPSDFWEPHQREQELASKATSQRSGHSFYAADIPLRDEDSAALTGLLSVPRSYRAHRPQKSCSGFHADYCLEWRSADTVIQAILALECAEIVLSKEDVNLKCDLSSEAALALRLLLKSYRQHRPEPAAGP